MKKIFSLISKKAVSANQKIIPAKEFSTLQNAVQILQRVEEEEKELKETLNQEAKKEKERAFELGFQEGLESFATHLVSFDHQLKVIRGQLEKKALPLILKAARKIIGEELQTHPDRVADIVRQALKPVTQCRKVTIYANREDLKILENHKPEIKKLFEHLDYFSIQERADIEPGGCMIETEAGIINAQLENLWRAMESAFQSFKNP